jgi:hypothetical protein
VTWRISNTDAKGFEFASSAEQVSVNQLFSEEFLASMTKLSVKHSAAERAGIKDDG